MIRFKPSTALFVSAFMLLFFNSQAQNGYTLTINTKNANGKMMFLSYFNGSPSIRSHIDSVAIVSDSQVVIFQTDKKIIGGIYQLNFKDEPKNTINLVIDNGVKLRSDIDGTTFINLKPSDKLNQDFISYQMRSSNSEETQKQLKGFISTYPGSVFSLFSKLELKKTTINISMIKDSSNAIKIRNDYFEGIDLQDKRIPLLPNIFPFLFKYITLLSINNENYQKNVDVLFKNSDCNSRNYIFYLDWIYKNIAYFERHDLSETYQYIYATYLNKDTVCKNKNERFYAKILEGLDKLDELRINTIIPSFEMEDSSGVTYNIQQLYSQSEFTFIAFYDPQCEHCKELMPAVEEYFRVNKLDNKPVKTIAFHNAMVEENWEHFIVQNHLEEWLNVHGKKGDKQYLQDLKVYSNPHFFLIDATGKIILKNFNPKELNEILRKRGGRSKE